MIPIHTKKIRKKWFCFSTFDGYDYSYTGKTKEGVQDKMKKRLKKSNLEGHALFLSDEIISGPSPENKPQTTWRPPKIDNNPFA
jgi:hypothetical protein